MARSTRFDVRPRRPGARVEQHADEREIDACACDLGLVAAGQRRVEFSLAVDAAGLEVAPAAVERDRPVAEALARQRGDAVGHGGQSRAIEREVRRGAGVDRGGDVRAALADRRRVAQRRDTGRKARAAHSASPRPLTLASVASSGTAPSVK